MRIAFVIPNLGAGGAERVASLLCNEWVGTGHEVSAMTFEPRGVKPVYILDEQVALEQIDALNVTRSPVSLIAANVRRVSRLRATLKQFVPDVIVAFTTEANVVALWAASGLDIPVVVSERNQPDRPGLGRARRAARRLTYPYAAAIVVQTEAIAAWARRRFRVPVHVLPNPVRLDAAVCRQEGQDGEKRLVAVGRLVPQKGFDRLIASFARLAIKHPDWKLTICGEGVERGALEAEIQRLSLAGRVSLPGVKEDMHQIFAEATLFVLPSRFEGYPNVLLEALAAGCPVVATDCPGATAEILDDGRYGSLVTADDDDALTFGLDHMMSDEALRAGYAAKASQAVEHLDVAPVARRWLDLFAALDARTSGLNS
jgi:glycosyltransferase involved in cell wall biosynthesis